MKKPSQRACIRADGDDPLAAMSFVEIARVLGGTPPQMRSAYREAMKKLRRDPVALADLRGLQAELERRRPVQFDWFGGDEEETA